MKRILALVGIVLFCAIIVNAGDPDYWNRTFLREAGELTPEKIDSLLKLPRELSDVLTADTVNAIIPICTLAIFDPDLEYLLVLYIEDTIRTTRYRMGSPEKRK